MSSSPKFTITGADEDKEYPSPSSSLALYNLLEGLSLNQLLIKIKTDIESGLGKTKQSWPGLMASDAIRLHEVLLSLRHWEDDIRNDAGVLSALEKDMSGATAAPFKSLAASVRCFLSEIHGHIQQIQETLSYENDGTASNEMVEVLIDDLEHTVECLRTQVEPLQRVFDAITKGTLVLALAPLAGLTVTDDAVTEEGGVWDRSPQEENDTILTSEAELEPASVPTDHINNTLDTNNPNPPKIPLYSLQTTNLYSSAADTESTEDQTPPCDILVVENLPLDATAEELIELFSKQDGYMSLYFRADQDGSSMPMCFVKFEDLFFATQALRNLHGYKLRNSSSDQDSEEDIITLSFFKDQLRVPSASTASSIPSPSTPSSSSVATGGMGGTWGHGHGGLLPPAMEKWQRDSAREEPWCEWTLHSYSMETDGEENDYYESDPFLSAFLDRILSQIPWLGTRRGDYFGSNAAGGIADYQYSATSSYDVP